MPRAPRLCIFCGSNANSKEHIWPTWLHELLGPVRAGARHNRQHISFSPREGHRVSGPVNRQGDQRTIRIRSVCSACNNGWMNDLERAVRPIITPLVLGEHAVLFPGQLETMAKWLSLKVMVVEHNIPETALTPQADRTALHVTGVVPRYFRLYCAHNIGNDALFFQRHTHTMGLVAEGPVPPLDGTFRNVQVVTLVVGKAIFQAVCTRLDDFCLEDRAIVIGFHDRCRFWPQPPDSMAFPSRPRLDFEGIQNVASMLERYIATAKPQWFEHMP